MLAASSNRPPLASLGDEKSDAQTAPQIRFDRNGKTGVGETRSLAWRDYLSADDVGNDYYGEVLAVILGPGRYALEVERESLGWRGRGLFAAGFGRIDVKLRIK